MVQGVTVAAARDVLVVIRHTTLFVVTLADSQQAALVATHELLHELPEELQNPPAQMHNQPSHEGKDTDKDTKAEEISNNRQRVTAVAFFQPEDSSVTDVFALLVLLDERVLVHYEVSIAAGLVHVCASRVMPRNSTCMLVTPLPGASPTRYVVVVGEKTGEAVAMPFPMIARELRPLLGHTTSMITHMAVHPPLSHSNNTTNSLLLTADRDEKVRVSQFPRTSLVQSYCLGHTASVTHVAVVPSNTTTTTTNNINTNNSMALALAVSTSLDNTIKLWDVSTGKQLHSQPLVTTSHSVVEEERRTALRHVSVAVSHVRPLVAALIPFTRELRFFALQENHTLAPRTLTTHVDGYVGTHAPSHVAFTASGQLVITYRQSPFLRVFDVANVTEQHVVLAERSDTQAAFAQLRALAAAIELPREEEDATEDTDGGLQKKKIKLNEWKAKLPAPPPPPQQQQ